MTDGTHTRGRSGVRTLVVVLLLAVVAVGAGVAGAAASEDPDTLEEHNVTVHFVGDLDEDDGALDTITLFEDEVPPEYDIEYINVFDVNETVIAETDIFVLYDTGEDDELITTIEDDMASGAVYLDQWSSGDSNAIPDRSAAIDDPDETFTDSFGTSPVEYAVQAEHPIFEGVAAANESVDIHTGGSVDFAYFEGASGETLADVQEQGGTGGPGVAVDPDSGSVLLAGIAVESFVDLEDYTVEAGQILGNAVEFAEPAETPFFAVSDLDAPAAGSPGEEISVSATITNTGLEAGTQDVVFEFDGQVVDTEPDVSLDPDQNTTVTFTDIALPEETGVYEHGVSTDNDSQTAEISVEEEFFAVSDLDAPAVGAPGEEISVSATITNTGLEAGTQDVEFVFNESLVDTEPDVSLDPDQNTTVTFTDIALPEETGVYEHGVFTNDDNQTAEISVEEAFFAVSDLDAPREVDPGASIDVSATIENTADVTGTQDVEFVFDGAVADTEPGVSLASGENTTVTFTDIEVPEAEGFYEHGVFTEDDNATADIGVGVEFTDVAVAESVSDGEETLSIFADELPEGYATEVVLSVDILEDDLISEYDIFVFHDFGGADAATIIDTVEDDIGTGAVYLDQWGDSSNAIPDRSAAIDDPADTAQEDAGDTPVSYLVQADHPIFEGVAGANETVDIHESSFADRTWFTGAAGETLAEVGATGAEAGGPAVAVDPDSGSVLLSSIAVAGFVDAEDYTAEAGQILGNAVEFAEPADLEEAFFTVSDLDAPAAAPVGGEIDVSATITNIGEVADTQDVVFEFDGAEAGTEPDVTLDPAQNTTVTFTDIALPEETGVYEHGVFTDDDSQTAEISVEDAFFAVSDLQAPAEADPGELIDVSATIENTAGVAGTQDVEFVFDGAVVDTEPDVSLESGQDTTVEFTDIELPAESGIYEHGVFTDDDNQTADIAVGVDLTTVTVVESGSDGAETLGLFEDQLPGTYEPQVVDAANVTEAVIAETDIFVFHDFGDGPEGERSSEDGLATSEESAVEQALDADIESLITTVEDDITTGAVYLDQWGTSSDAIPDRSEAIGDPADTDQAYSTGDSPVEFVIEADHPIFDGVGGDGDLVDIHFGGTADFTWFEGASGETLATAQNQAVDGGPAVAVDPDTGSVLISSIAVSTFVDPEDYTDEAGQILGNAVEHAEPEDIEGAFFAVSDLQAPTEADPGESIDVSATVTNIGDEMGTQDIVFEFDGAEAGTEPDVTLDPDGETVVEFTDIGLPDEGGFYEHGVFSANDSATATIQVGTATIELVELDQPATLTMDGDITTEITVTNSGDLPYEGELLQVTNLNDTEPESGAIAIPDNDTAVTLDPGESVTVSDTLGTFAELNDALGTEFGPGDDVLTGYWLGQDLAEAFDPGTPDPVIEDIFAEEISIIEEAPFFEVSDLDAPAQAGPGETIDVSATVTNVGAVAGTQDVVFEFDGAVVETEPDVSLDPDQGTVVEFTDIALPEESGTYEHGVFTDDDGQTAEISVAAPPEIELSGLDIAGQGDQATILQSSEDVTVNVTHVGGDAGTVDVTVTIDDNVDTETVELGVDETVTVTFENATADIDPDLYEVVVTALDQELTGGLMVSLDVVGEGNPATDTTGDGLLNDVTGEGTFDIFDVQALFDNLDNEELQASPQLFDFAGAGGDRVSIFDVQGLFTELSAQG